MKRLVCWWVGHDWDVYLVNQRKHVNLVHLHSLAGCKAYCRRCGEEWDDLWSPFFGDDVAVPVQRGQVGLPRAQVRGR